MSNVQNEMNLLVSSDPSQGAILTSLDGSVFSISLGSDGIRIPPNAYNVTLEVPESTVWFTTPNILSSGTSQNNLLRITGLSATNVVQTYNIVIQQGLYDLSGLNNAILRELENQGAKTVPSPLINFSADDNTQRVVLTLNYIESSVQFIAGSMYEILGWNLNDNLTTATAPLNILAPNVAAFNQVNYFLIKTDLVNRGIRFNNNYSSIISQVLIDKAPGSQILFRPFNPIKLSVPELIGTNRTLIKFYLTDDRGRPVNTNGEYWTARISIKWME
jgi:hypothetical protein